MQIIITEKDNKYRIQAIYNDNAQTCMSGLSEDEVIKQVEEFIYS